MGRFNPAKTSFVAGELSPRLEGRDDLDQYSQGMRQALNGVVLPHGGFMRRSATRHVAEVRDSDQQVLLAEFQASITQNYVLEHGGDYIRFYADEGRLEDDGNPIEIEDCPWDSTTLADMQWAQSADVQWIVHPDNHPYKLSRTSATEFSLDKVVWREGHAPLRPENLTTTTLTITGTGTVATFSAAVLEAAWDEGRYIRHKVGAVEAWYSITSVTSSTVAVVVLQGGTTTTALGASDDWALGLFSDYEGARAVVLHQGRLCYGGTYTEPDRVVLSVSDDFDNFELKDAAATDAVNADKSIAKRVVHGQMNAIQWLASSDLRLVIGTAGGEFVMEGEAGSGVLTPTASNVRPKTSRGSIHAQPALVGGNVVFLQRNARKLREFGVFASDSGASEDLPRDISILAEHILTAGATAVKYQQDPDSIIWVLRADGVVVGFTREQEQRVVGAHRHVVGGSYLGGDPVIESIAVIPSPSGDQDHLWAVVKRTLDEQTVRTVEYFEDTFRPTVTNQSTQRERILALEPCFYVDCGVSLDEPLGGGVTAISNASPAVVQTATAHGLADGDRVRIRDVTGYNVTDADDTEYGSSGINGRSFTVKNPTDLSFELYSTASTPAAFDGSAYTSYDTGGSVRQETQTVEGADYLIGETVQILADGAARPEQTVTGPIDLGVWASIVHIGLGYPTVGETQRFFGGGRLGTDQGQNMRVQRVVARIHDTLGLKIRAGASADYETVSFKQGTDLLDLPPPLRVTDDIEVPGNSGWTKEATVTFRQDDPLPATVLSIYPRMESGER